jgi:hypothetical protein
MAENPDDQQLAAHIESVSSRPDPDTERLIALLMARSPACSSDRSEPGALDWVRRWGPRPVAFAVPTCSCSVGRCRVCN